MTSPPRRTPFSSQAVDLDGVRTRYIDVRPAHGEASPPVVLLHGHASRIEEYDPLVPYLSRERRVIVLDLPGCGEADKPSDRPYTLQLYEDTVLGLLDRLGVKQLDAAGGSLGGNLTLRLGAREPQRFRRLAAWSPAGAWEPLRGWQRVAKVMRRFPRLFWLSMWVQSRFWYSRDWAGRTAALEEAFRYFKEAWGPGFFRMYWDVGHDQAAHSLFHIVHRITQPVFLGWGDRDHAMGMGKGVKRLEALLPNARLHVFSRASHSLANERTEELGRLVDTFLR